MAESLWAVTVVRTVWSFARIWRGFPRLRSLSRMDRWTRNRVSASKDTSRSGSRTAMVLVAGSTETTLSRFWKTFGPGGSAALPPRTNRTAAPPRNAHPAMQCSFRQGSSSLDDAPGWVPLRKFWKDFLRRLPTSDFRLPPSDLFSDVLDDLDQRQE